MGKNVEVCVLTGYGINAEKELAEAFRVAGGKVRLVHVQDLLSRPDTLKQVQILAFPGGFSFGDHLGSGKVLANLMRKKLKPELEGFVFRGGLMLGVCNGFQILVKMGILPNLEGEGKQEVSLMHNECGSFVDRWVKVRFNRKNPSPWIQGMETSWYPIRHGEGRFLAGPLVTGDRLLNQNLIALTYAEENPNGSELNIAGITDPTGRILGLMPHPEAFLIPENHPWWPRRSLAGEEPANREIPAEAGLQLFKNGIEFARGIL